LFIFRFINKELRLMNVQRLRISLPVLIAALAIVETARGQHFDIFLARPATGTQTVIGAADVDAQVFDDVTRVFEGEMGALGGEFVALEPGVNHPNLNDPIAAYPSSAAGLMPGDVLRLMERDFSVDGLVDDLFYWNGVGAVSFVPAAANFRIDGGDPLGSMAGVGGSFDDHPFLVVDSDALPGIYLASVTGVVDGFDPSDPAYLVFATGEEFEDAHGQAAEYVQANLVVPEPASLALVVIACGALLAIRR
jgi:hypothetical protein